MPSHKNRSNKKYKGGNELGQKLPAAAPTQAAAAAAPGTPEQPSNGFSIFPWKWNLFGSKTATQGQGQPPAQAKTGIFWGGRKQQKSKKGGKKQRKQTRRR